jgi:hypothetical protein
MVLKAIRAEADSSEPQQVSADPLDDVSIIFSNVLISIIKTLGFSHTRMRKLTSLSHALRPAPPTNAN